MLFVDTDTLLYLENGISSIPWDRGRESRPTC